MMIAIGHQQVDQGERRVQVQGLVQQRAPERQGARVADRANATRTGGASLGRHQRALGSHQRLGARDPRPHQHHHEDQRHQHERQRGRGRVIGQLQVAALDHVSDHGLPWCAEQLRVDEVARRRDERQQTPRDDSGHRERQGDPGEHRAP